MVNKYPGPCAACGNNVPAGAGTLTKTGGKWLVRHDTCDRAAPVTEPRGQRCANCGRPGARNARRDSSGIPGMVCGSCNREADYELSFA